MRFVVRLTDKGNGWFAEWSIEGSGRLRSPITGSSNFGNIEDAIRWLAAQAAKAGALGLDPADLDTKILWDNHAPSALL
jgi:hypothetical protein